MIEESGENWFLYTDTEHPHTIQVLTERTSVERTVTFEGPAKRTKKTKKAKPFGFARALPKAKKGKR